MTAKRTSKRKTTILLDLANLRETFNYNEEKVKHLVKWILDDTSLQISLIISAMEKEDYGQISKSSHRIKGSATQIDSDKLYKLVSELEEMGIAGTMEKIPEKLEDLKECFKEISESLKKEILY